jgi:DNA-binding PadR family transcriptional regulator
VSFQNVVLGELIRRRGFGYGYEVREQLHQLSEVLGYSDTLVYSALDALERKGFVRPLVEPGEVVVGRRTQANSRVYYEVTDEGVTHYGTWMASVPEMAPLREDLHMQLMAAKADDVPHLIVAFCDFEDQCRTRLRYLMTYPLSSRTIHGEMVGATLVKDALVTHVQSMIEWAQRSRRSLTTLTAHPPGAPGRRRP